MSSLFCLEHCIDNISWVKKKKESHIMYSVNYTVVAEYCRMHESQLLFYWYSCESNFATTTVKYSKFILKKYNNDNKISIMYIHNYNYI